eukprot:1926484-Rhodomonas_salina.1
MRRKRREKGKRREECRDMECRASRVWGLCGNGAWAPTGLGSRDWVPSRFLGSGVMTVLGQVLGSRVERLGPGPRSRAYGVQGLGRLCPRIWRGGRKEKAERRVGTSSLGSGVEGLEGLGSRSRVEGLEGQGSRVEPGGRGAGSESGCLVVGSRAARVEDLRSSGLGSGV